jgi:hypothetical protein
MQNNSTGNASTTQNSDVHGPTCRDWREERREWRRERRDARYRFPFHGLFLGLTLILLGTLFLLNQLGQLTGNTWWQVLLIGLGVISIINGLVRYRHSEYRWFSYGRFVTGIVLVLIGTLLILGFSQWWPLALVIAGVVLLLRFFWRR